MAGFDALRLKSVLVNACRTAFAEVRASHKGESFYCMGLFTSGLFGYLVPTAMTEEGLDRVVREYQADPAYANEPPGRLRFSLRWSTCDSPLHLEGASHFDEVNVLMAEVSEAFSAIDIDHGWGEFEDFARRIETLICEVLTLVDQEGVFGVGKEREGIFVTMLMGDQDDSILTIGRRLNPPATVKRFENEWRAWCDFCESESER